MRNAMLALVVLLCVASSAQAADKWTVTGMGGAGGMYTPTISPFDAKLMFLSCDMSGAYRSLDGGRTWELIHYKQLRGSRMTRPAFLDKDTVYWAEDGSLRITRDRGATWTPIAGPWKDTITHLVVAHGKPAHLVVGTGSGVWEAPLGADGAPGAWKQLAAGPCSGLASTGDSAYFATRDGKVLHFMAGTGKDPYALAQSPAAGKAIIALAASNPNTGARDETLPDVLAAIVDGVGTFWSNDLGNTWEKSQPWQSQKDLLMPAGGKVAWTAQEGGHEVWRTADGGKTWTSVFQMGGRNGNVQVAWTQTFLRWDYSISHLGIGIDPNNPNVAMMTSEGDFYRTADGGKSWGQCQNDPAGAGFRSIGLEVTSLWGYYFDPIDPNRHYICYTDIGFARSVDKGATWISASKGSPWSNTFYEIAFDPRVKGRIYAACSNRHDIPHWTHLDANKSQHAGGVCVSDDFGASWRVLGAGQPKLPCTSIAIDPKSPQGKLTLYAAFYEGGVYKSADGGQSWQKKSTGLGNEGNLHCARLRFHPVSGKLYCLITGFRRGNREFPVPGGLWVSSDGAETWKDLTASNKFPRPTDFALHPRDENIIYVNASTIPGREIGGIYKTSDGGASWTRLIGDAQFAKWCGPSYFEGSTINIHPDDPNLLYAGSDGHGFWYSKDAGKTWKPFESFPFSAPQNVAFEPTNGKVMIVTSFGAGAWKGPYLPGN
jgi:photosystem II stability/assembly factor-like uncharacterized protein